MPDLKKKASEASQKAGEEVLKTTDEVHEYGIGPKVRETAHRLDEKKADFMGGALKADARGQLGLSTILAALVVVIAVSLAVIVVDRFDESLGSPSSSSLSTAQNDVLSGFADMTSLVGPLLLVSIAVVIIGLIRRVQ